MKLQKTLFALAFACSPVVFAAGNGSLGESSEANTDIELVVPKLVQVSVGGDISLPYTTAGGTSNSAGLCIYSKETANVDVTITTDNGSFVLSDGTDTVPYSVALSNTGGSIGGFTYNSALGVTDANTTAASCGGEFPHSLDVSVTQNDLDSAPASTYADTIYVTVAAQ